MAQYVSNTSDKSKKKAMILALFGIGLNYFYVARLLHGLIRFIIGGLMWMMLFTYLGDKTVVILSLVIIFVPVLWDEANLFFGTFKDNVGNYLRED